METMLALGIDLVLILVLVLGVYYPRYRRQDLVVAFLVVNLGVFALAMTLGSMSVGAGFGIGLFGVLSIIRLRSSEIDQIDVAYYFGSLVLGLVSALVTLQTPEAALLGLLIVVVLAIADSPRFTRKGQHVQIRLDHAYQSEGELTAALHAVLQADITSIKVTQIDQVQDSTMVEVTYRQPVPVSYDRAGLARMSQ